MEDPTIPPGYYRKKWLDGEVSYIEETKGVSMEKGELKIVNKFMERMNEQLDSIAEKMQLTRERIQFVGIRALELQEELADEKEKVKILTEGLKDMRGYDHDRVDRWLAKVKK